MARLAADGPRAAHRHRDPAPRHPGRTRLLDLDGGMMTRLGQIPGRLYRGDISVNIVGRQRMWYTISGLIVLVSAVALAVRGLNFSVEFRGGSVFEFPASPSAQ